MSADPVSTAPPTVSTGSVQRIDLDRSQRGAHAPIRARHHRQALGAMLLVGDALLLTATLGIFLPWERIINDPWWIAATTMLIAMPGLAVYCLGGYRSEAIASTGPAAGRPRHMAAAAVIGALLGLLAYKGLLVWPIGRNEGLNFTARTWAAPICLGLWVYASRAVARALLRRWESRARVVGVAAAAVADRLVAVLREAGSQVPLIRIDPTDATAAARIDAALDQDGPLRAVVVDAGIGPLPTPMLEAFVHARIAGVPVISPSELVEELLERSPVGLGDPAWMVGAGTLRQASSLYLSIKRLIDLGVAIPMFVVLLPVMVGTAIAVKLTSRGPALFTQTREGLYKRPFTILKFRTMRTDAEAAGAQWATKNDPRVTPIGAFLRKSRLDEFPQLINVILGDMSLVGPRPERPEFNGQLAEQIPWYDLRHLSKPGLTGWAQVRYPYGASVADAVAKLEFEIYYLKRASTAFDLRILLRTIAVVVGLRGR